MTRVERAQPVEGPRETCVHEAVKQGYRLECPKCGLVLARYTDAPVEGVERVTDDAPARVEPQPCLFQDYAGEGNIAFCELPVGHDNGVHEPVAQPAKHTDDRTADTIPDDQWTGPDSVPRDLRNLWVLTRCDWDKIKFDLPATLLKTRELIERTGRAESSLLDAKELIQRMMKEQQAAETRIEVLEAALRKVVTHPDTSSKYNPAVDEMRDIARAALAAPSGDTTKEKV